MKRAMKEDKKAKSVAKTVVKLGKKMERHEDKEIKSMKKGGMKKGCY